MYTTSVLTYIPRQIVVLYSGSSSTRYQTVYSKNLTLHKGVDNQIQFQFINQEQKPVDISNVEITCRVMNNEGDTILLQQALTPLLPLNGLATLNIANSALITTIAQTGYYSLSIPNGAFNYPVFVDEYSGGRGIMNIVDSILPQHNPSNTMPIPSYPTANTMSVTANSSVYLTSEQSNFTIQSYFTDIIGNIQVQGSIGGTVDWYDIGNTVGYGNSANSFSVSGTDYYQVTGFHPYIRVKFTITNGTVDKLYIR